MFEHRHAESVSAIVQYGPDGKCETTLVVTTKLRIDLATPGEGPDAFAFDALTGEALDYKNEHNIDHLRVISVGSG